MIVCGARLSTRLNLEETRSGNGHSRVMDTYGGRSHPISAESDRGVGRLHPCNRYLRPAAMMREDPFLSSPWRSEDIRTDGPLEPSWSRTRPAHEVRGHDLEGRRRGDRQ